MIGLYLNYFYSKCSDSKFDTDACDSAPILKDETPENKRIYCIEIVQVVNCLEKTLKRLDCKNTKPNKNRHHKAISFREKIERQINFYNEIFALSCESITFFLLFSVKI